MSEETPLGKLARIAFDVRHGGPETVYPYEAGRVCAYIDSLRTALRKAHDLIGSTLLRDAIMPDGTNVREVMEGIEALLAGGR